MHNIECFTDEERYRKSVYVGESSHCGCDRGAEHLKVMENESEETPMIEHQNLEYPGEVPRFKMKIVEFTKFNLKTRAKEAHQIELFMNKYNILYRRGEW